MMVNGVAQRNPMGAGAGVGQGPAPTSAGAMQRAQVNSNPGGALSAFNMATNAGKYAMLSLPGMHGALINAGLDPNQLNQFANYSAYHGADNGNLGAGADFSTFSGASNSGTGLQRGANFGGSNFDAFANAGAQPQPNNPRFGPGGFGPPPPSGGGSARDAVNQLGGSFNGANNSGSFGAPSAQVPNGGSFNPYAPVQGGNPLPPWMSGSPQPSPGGPGQVISMPGRGPTGSDPGYIQGGDYTTGGQPRSPYTGLIPTLPNPIQGGAVSALQQMQQAQRAYPQGRMQPRIGQRF